MDLKKAFRKIINVAMGMDDYSEEGTAVAKAIFPDMTEEEIQKEFPVLHPDWEGEGDPQDAEENPEEEEEEEKEEEKENGTSDEDLTEK